VKQEERKAKMDFVQETAEMMERLRSLRESTDVRQLALFSPSQNQNLSDWPSAV